MSGDLTRKRRRLALIIGGGFAAAGVLYWIYKRRKGDANDDHGANRPPAEGGWEIVDRGEDNVLSPAAPAGRDDTTPHQLLTSMLSKESLLPTLKVTSLFVHCLPV